MRIIMVTLSLLALAACNPPVPDSGAGFGNEFQGGMTPATGNLATAGELPVSDEVIEGEIPPVNAGSVSISNEQDFGVVSGRETIESDAARIAANRDLYVIVEPTELPSRPGNSMSLVVEYALATTNPVGQPLYNRSGFMAESRFNRGCAKYTSDALAQEAFLEQGGPKRDPNGLDPDGDGFACFWSPEPYRQARLAAQQADPVAPAE